MKQTAPISLDSFDPEVLAAAREVARRAGVPLESWIESVAGPGPSKPTPRRRRTDAPTAAGRMDKRADRVSDRVRSTEDAATQAPVPATDASPQKRREPAAAASAVAASSPVASLEASLEASLGAMMRRLDAIDRSISQERDAAKADAARMIGEIETRLSAAPPPTPGGIEAIAERFTDIERKMTEITGQLGAPRPLGRRGRPIASEVRDAVAEVRRRQRELEEGIAAWNSPAAVEPPALVESSVQAEQAPGDESEPSPAIAELQRETSRLRDALGGLATGRHVGELEQTIRAVSTDLGRTRDPEELAAIAAPIELMRVHVERLAEGEADTVHARIVGEVERLAEKVEGAHSGAATEPADRTVLDNVFRELDEIRRLVAALAGPERIQSLAQGVQAISAQIAGLRNGGDAGVETLRPILEEIRSELRTPDESRALLGRFEALAERIDRADGAPADELMVRLEQLAEKVDRVSAGGSGLDALERHVLALANRLDAPHGTDPALTRLERSMGDLLAQVSALRSGTGFEAAIERATREAMAGAAGPLKVAGGEVVLLRADLADLRATQKSSDQRLQTTMEGVQAVLSRLSEQLDRTMTSTAALTAAAPQDRFQAERGIQERVAQERVAQERIAHERPAAPKAAGPGSVRPRRPAPAEDIAAEEAHRPSDELLEPGAGRPAPGRSTAAESESAAGSDIKTSFIAAARRAAQAAQAETATDTPLTVRLRDKVAPSATPAAETGPVSQLRGLIDGRRRTLLLGLAAVVLALGAYQAFVAGSDAPTGTIATIAPDTPKVGAAPEAVASQTTAAKAEAEKADAAQSAPAQAETPAAALPDPTTTQSIGPKAGKRVLPQIAGMSALGPDLAGLPPALTKLKQEALDGDAAAIWEIAAREAEGRGVTRDLALAAKLYERLAQAGFAPAQVKTGNAYEKGSGVARDIAQAKLWYGRAADQGNVRAMHNLAVLHAENPAANGKPDFAASASAFRRAAEHGVRDSQYNLAVLYARGLGVGQDLVQSYLWFSAAAAQGDEEAGRKRDEVTTKLAPKDLAEARNLVAGFKSKGVDPAANEAPAPKTVPTAPVSLMGVPSPGLPSAASFQKRVGA